MLLIQDTILVIHSEVSYIPDSNEVVFEFVKQCVKEKLSIYYAR